MCFCYRFLNGADLIDITIVSIIINWLLLISQLFPNFLITNLVFSSLLSLYLSSAPLGATVSEPALNDPSGSRTLWLLSAGRHKWHCWVALTSFVRNWTWTLTKKMFLRYDSWLTQKCPLCWLPTTAHESSITSFSYFEWLPIYCMALLLCHFYLFNWCLSWAFFIFETM